MFNVEPWSCHKCALSGTPNDGTVKHHELNVLISELEVAFQCNICKAEWTVYYKLVNEGRQIVKDGRKG